MKNIAPGLSLKKYKGNKHEQGGIMVNALGNKTKDINKAVAEVEGGEYNYRYNPNNPKDNYILSEELGIARIAKQADRFKGNDRISLNTRNNILNKSLKLNEILRLQKEQQQSMQMSLGGMLKKYKPGGLLPYDGTNPMDDVSMQNSYRAVSTPGNEITNTPIQPTAPLLSGSQKFELPTKVQSVNPKVNNLDVSKEMEQASSPVKQKKNNFKGALSAVSGAVSALGPIGQGVGAALQLAPYAIDLGKAMFDKTSVQDLQTQGSAMRLPNTTYAKHGGKLHVKPLPKYILGGKSTPVVSDTPTAAEIEEAKKTRAKFNENPLTTLKTLPETIKSNKPGINDLTTLNIKNETNMLRKAGLNVVPQSFKSSELFKAGQKKQKLSEALMYGMAALPSEQIKTITPDYGRGDDAMSRMGLSTEPIRQEIMQGANKALELNRSQVGTAGQLQSRGQSIMSNVGSQLAQSQMQQQQYLNQMRGALAQREDTKSNVLAQSELTAREAKSAERAAKLDQLNNAISQTSAIGAGNMEQASKMSTIENENERFDRSQKNLLDLGNKAGSLKVIQNKDGTISYDFIGSTSGTSSIQTQSLAAIPAANTGTGIVPAALASPVVPAATTGDTYTVKSGDSLYRIAINNNMNLNQLLKLNPTKTAKSLILAGDKLKIK